VSTLFFYDYLLTWQDEASKLLLTAFDSALISNPGPIRVGRKETMECVRHSSIPNLLKLTDERSLLSVSRCGFSEQRTWTITF